MLEHYGSDDKINWNLTSPQDLALFQYTSILHTWHHTHAFNCCTYSAVLTACGVYLFQATSTQVLLVYSSVHSCLSAGLTVSSQMRITQSDCTSSLFFCQDLPR